MILIKIKNIEIEEGPFSDDYLDECIEKIDLTVNLHFTSDTIQLDALSRAIDAVEEIGKSKVIYIHSYPEEFITILGIKFGPNVNKSFFNRGELINYE